MSSQPEEISTKGPLYLQATKPDFLAIDFEEPIVDCKDADCSSISSLYRNAAKQAEEQQDYVRLNVYSTLSAICEFHFKSRDVAEPYSAMMVWADGRKTAIPEDFKGEILEALTDIAPKIRNLALKARVSDMIWVVDKSKHQLGTLAVETYFLLLQGIQAGELFFDGCEDGIFSNRVLALLRRALTMCRVLKNPAELFRPLADMVIELRTEAISTKNTKRAYRLSQLDLDFTISEPAEVAQSFEAVINGEEDLHKRSEFWDLSARGYHMAKLEEDKWRCKVEAAEALIAYSDTQKNAMSKSHWLSDGLAAYQSIPNQGARRKELRKKLIDSQRDVQEEMSPFGEKVDISKLVEGTERQLHEASLFKKLGILACISNSPDPEEQKKQAIESIREFPLSSLFGSTYHDSEGKVVHRGLGADMRTADERSIDDRIAEQERTRRQLVVSSAIIPVLRNLQTEHYIGEMEIYFLCANSPFVPEDRRIAFMQGVLFFLRGDQIPALNILVPQVENSIRHILKQNGFDPTSFDPVTQMQEDRPITSLYTDMRSEIVQCLGEDITLEIENVFIKKNGPNLRNLVAHGLLSDDAVFGPDAVYACWMIYRLCCLPLLPYWESLERKYKQI